MNRLRTHVAALIGALIGFYAGLVALLAVGGLESVGWAPGFMCAGSGLAAGAAVAITNRDATTRPSVVGLIGGLALGALFTALDPDLMVVAISLAVASQILAWRGRPDATEPAAS